MTKLRFLAVPLLIGALSACASGLVDQAEGIKPSGSEFLRHLHSEYIALAKAENAEMDYLDADHFAQKAIQAGSGKPVKPDAAASRKLPAGTTGAIEAAEKRLKTALDGGAMDYAPKQLARAQAMFDCWLQEQEENNQPKDIAACRSAFLDAMDLVDDAKPKKAEAKPAPKKPPFLGPFFIYFPFDVADPEDPFNQDIFKLIASTAKQVPDMNMHVTGHTDRAGNNKYNMALSEKRAYSVKASLIDRGIDPKRMKLFFMGEESPAKPTKDGVREDGNRRVEVFFK